MANDIIPGVTSNFSFGALLNTLNPVSRLYGSGAKDYVPLWLINAFKESKNNTIDLARRATQAAHIAAKTVSSIGTGAILAALIRSILQETKLDKINKAPKTAGLDLLKIYRRPYKAVIVKEQPELLQLPLIYDLLHKELLKLLLLEKTASGIIPHPSAGTTYNVTKVSVPITAAGIAALSALVLMDKYYDNKLAKKLNERLMLLLREINNIVLLRARLNRGVQKPTEVLEDSRLTKLASDPNSLWGDDRLLSSLSLLLLALFGASAFGGYAWANDKNKALKLYLARKKGLLAYTKARLALDITYQLGLDPLLVNLLDSNLKGKAPTISGDKAYSTIDI